MITRRSISPRTLAALTAGLCVAAAHAQVGETLLTPREQREQGREFRASPSMLEIFRARTEAAPDALQFSGSLGVSLARASDGSSAASLPAEVAAFHPRSGIRLALSSDVYAWAHDDSGTVRGSGAVALSASRKWKVDGDTSIAFRAAAVLDTGSDVSDPTSQSLAVIIGRKTTDGLSVSVVGSTLRGPQTGVPGLSRFVNGLSIRANHGFGNQNEQTLWAKISTGHRSGAASRQAAALGVDYVLPSPGWEGTVAVSRPLSGASRATSISLDIARNF